MVIPNRVKKYNTRIGQNTGMLNMSNNVQNIAIETAFVDECLQKNSLINKSIDNYNLKYQNLNSGKRRMKGLNSSLAFTGNDIPSAEINIIIS